MAGVKITTTYSNNSNSNNSDNGNELHVLNVWPSKDSFNLRGVAHDPTMHARRGVTPGALWGGGGNLFKACAICWARLPCFTVGKQRKNRIAEFED